MAAEVVFIIHIHLKTVIDFGVGEVVATAIYRQQFAVGDYVDYLVDEVDAPVEHHAAAVFFLFAPVAGNAERTVDARLDGIDVAEVAALIYVAHDEEFAVPTAVLMNGKEFAGALRCGDHFFKIGRAESDGFFTDDVFAGLKSGYAKRLVKIVWDGKSYDVDFGVGQNRFKRGVCVNAVFFGNFATLGIDVINTPKCYDVAVLNVLAVPAAHATVTDDHYVLFHFDKYGSAICKSLFPFKLS